MATYREMSTEEWTEEKKRLIKAIGAILIGCFLVLTATIVISAFME
jgi:hypothetical protein